MPKCIIFFRERKKKHVSDKTVVVKNISWTKKVDLELVFLLYTNTVSFNILNIHLQAKTWVV